MSKINYVTLPVRELSVEVEGDGKKQNYTVKGQKLSISGRFWNSLCSMYSTHGLNTKLFKLFNPREVFTRLNDVASKDRIRVAVEDDKRLLAATDPGRPVVDLDSASELIARNGGEKNSYHDGVITSWHTPNNMEPFKIGPDAFSHRFVMETPIDGFGAPLIYLSLLRQVCTNGAIGYANAFRSEINIGRSKDRANPLFTMQRAIESFSNEEGFDALRKRFEAASRSWASIAECSAVYNTIIKMGPEMFKDEQDVLAQDERGGADSIVDVLAGRRNVVLGGDAEEGADGYTMVKIQRAYTQLTGDLCAIYGLTHLDALTHKKMQRLPAKCTMYDLMNFTTEVATHYTRSAIGSKKLQALIGQFVTSDYDMESSKDTKESFQDWFVTAS